MRHLVTAGVLAGALFLYYIGLSTPATAAIFGAMLLEIVFWKRLISRRR